MILSFHPCFLGDTQVILGDGIIDSHDLGHIRAAEAIILPQNCPLELYQACKNSSALLFPDYEARFEYPGKIGQSFLFEKLKCPYPETRQWLSVKAFKKAYPKAEEYPHRIPFLIKADETHEAERIYPITDQGALESSLEDLGRLESSGFKGFISQEMISTEGNVLRAVILGCRTITYWKRGESPEQIITTLSRGAKIDKEWRTDLQERGKIQAREFSAATGINLAAVDFVFSFSRPDPQPLFLEINYYFGRRGLGGSLNYYRLLHKAIQEWLSEKGLDPKSIRLI
jgi:ribosomal protein S6--L-glutamate ligase